ncbi:MAG: inositol monophosphatase family protein [Gemmatimonadota bacterium]
MADRIESAEALAVAREAAADAVTILRARLANADAGGAERKQARDFVTIADEAAEAAIVERLGRAFPDHAIVAEESGGRAGRSPWRWLIDPLDGTTNFVHAFPVFAVSIALFEDETPVLGLVVDVVRGEWFTARAGAGAQVDDGDPGAGHAIRVSTTGDPERRLVATGFPFRWPDLTDLYLSAFRDVFGRVGDMRRAGAAALDLAWTAAGRVDGFWEIGLSPWDIAAGEVLVLEAGGRVTDWIGGSDHRRTGWVAVGSPAVHAMLVETLTPYFEEATRG